MTEFTPGPAALGGLLIGLSAALLMLATGRIAGVSGFLVRLLPPYEDGAHLVRLAFVAGILAAPLLYATATGGLPAMSLTDKPLILAVGGLLTGYGAVRGGGCTSGHGICGMARISTRSIAATMIFMTTAAATVYVARHVVGG